MHVFGGPFNKSCFCVIHCFLFNISVLIKFVDIEIALFVLDIVVLVMVVVAAVTAVVVAVVAVC